MVDGRLGSELSLGRLVRNRLVMCDAGIEVVEGSDRFGFDDRLLGSCPAKAEFVFIDAHAVSAVNSTTSTCRELLAQAG